MRSTLLLLLVACAPEPVPDAGHGSTVPSTGPSTSAPTTPGDPPTTAPTTGSTGSTGTPTTDPGTTGSTTTTAVSDEDRVRDLIASVAPLDEVLAAVAWSGGFPVPTAAGTHLFVHAAPGAWHLMGDHDDWVGAPMEQADGFSWAEVTIPDAAGSRYKFADGPLPTADPWARAFTWDEFGEISYVEPPADRWRMDRWPDLDGAGLGPRDVHVYVPAGAGPWPVLYAQDGQNLFDPAAIWGGWRMQDALAEVGDALVVGVHNTPDRFDEYTHVPDDIGFGPMGGRGDDYATLVHEILRPRMEDAYGSTGVHGVLGSSLGGLISLHIAERYPDDYDFVASLSGTLGWGRFVLENDAMEARWLATGPGGPVVYVDSGADAGDDGVCRDPDGDGYYEDDPDSADNYCVTRGFADALAAAGWEWGADLHHWHERGASHDEAAWAERVHIPLGLFLSLDP